MRCPKCSSKEYVKSGFSRRKQRYKCGFCGCHFTQSHNRNASIETKLQALRLYREGVGFRGIGRILGFSDVAVLNWIREFGKDTEVTVECQNVDLKKQNMEIDVVKMDEM